MPGSAEPTRRLAVLALAGLLFGLVFLLRVLVEGGEEGLLLLWVIPVAMLAVEFGLRGGLGGAVAAIGLLLLYGLVTDPDFGVLGYLTRGGTFVLIGGLVGVLADRTRELATARERVAAEERTRVAVRDTEGLKSAMLESALDCVIAIDHAGRVVEFNPAAERTFGFRRSEAIGQEMAVLIVPPELRDRHRAALRRCVETGEGRILDTRLELTGMRSDGSTFPVELAITRVPEASPPIFTGYVREITERKRQEEDLESQREQLAWLAEERARLVVHALEAEDRERRRLSQVLHDDALQTLIAVEQDLGEASGGDGREGPLHRAREALDRTIRQLRDTALELHPLLRERQGLPAALDAIAKGTETLGRFRCSIRVAEGAAGVNDQLVLSVARELLMNAAKHAGARRVSVIVERVGDDVALEVADDGRGIEPELVEAALSEGHLGLATLSERLGAIGGTLELSNRPQGGALVRARCPAAAAESAAIERPAAS